MKFFATLPIAALLALAAAAPSPAPSEASLEPVTMTNPPTPEQLLHLEDNESVFVEAEGKRAAEKRATQINVGVWEQKWNGGAKGIFTVALGQCYAIGSQWNDAISSLEVPQGYSCVFFASYGCNFNEHARLYVHGQFIGDLDPWGLNKKLSSIYCYTQ
ncbi:hypothetical protein K458DRAFT_403636 [Lentithecium fluviatile CBS 122367]|uniref:Uncharacterized protein n=1 Tax=Lentithecium fluviatile CBS 122367 TaxID=1168545 RepID=A0A6G1J5Q8_9PLEO|nr:hypothetical protein K458DRAFT_403636 [Lentithecium fluviatile CBS 122367]